MRSGFVGEWRFGTGAGLLWFSPFGPLEAFVGTQAGLLMFLFVVIVAGGVREELQRAFLLHRFRFDLGQPWMGVFITSLAFGMGHTLQGLDVAIITGLLGALWGVGMAAMLWQFPDVSRPLFLVSLAYPALYGALSLVLHFRRR